VARSTQFLLWLFSLVALSVQSCTIDGRKLHVTAGSAGTSGTAGTAGSDGTAGSIGAAGDNGGLGAGEKCSANSDCLSGPCLDGVCCAKACSGSCVSCSADLTGQAAGTCAPVQAGSDPHDDCTKGTDDCGLDGQCDGAGACRFAPPSTTCGAEACAADEYTPAAQCDGAGKCVTPTAISCGGHPCTGTRCDIPCSKPADCPMGLFCDGTVCAPQKTNGTQCAADAECSNAHCVEGVCCGDVCSAKCNSCLQANTGQTDGTCAPVRAGVAHGTDCPGSANCPAGSTMFTPAPTCDGAGACKSTAASCGNYLCNAATMLSCATTCTANAQCSTGYCAANACKVKSAAGQLCSSNAQCQSGTCSGRCCAAGTPCTCPQPTTSNVIKNPGFDTNLASWTVDTGPASITWQPGTLLDGNGSYADADACGYSGSAYIAEPDSGDSQSIWQCVPMTAHTSYNFDVRIATLSGANAICDLDAYQGPGCTGNVSNMAEVSWLNVGWSSNDFPTTFDSSFFVSAKISCHVQGGGAFFFDEAFLAPAPGMY